jgi:DNA-binding NarL/FixJ family response regulator
MNYLIVDPYWASRKGLSILVESMYQSAEITEFQSLKEVLSSNSNLIKSTNNTLLLDADIVSKDFLLDFRKVKKHFPKMKVIAIVSSVSYFHFFEIKQYIHAILSKQDIENKLLGTMQFVSNGYKDYFPGINQDSLSGLKKLTPRELEVAVLLSQGFGNKEIVWKLNLKKETISTYRKRVFIKLNINNNIELKNYFTKSII